MRAAALVRTKADPLCSRSPEPGYDAAQMGALPDPGASMRLTPEMVSRKLLALHFVRTYLARHGVGPSLGEIGAGVGVSRQRAQWYVKQLEAGGYVTRTPRAPRSIRLAARAELGAHAGVAGQGGAGAGEARALTHMGLPMLPTLLHASSPDIEE